MKDLTIGVVFVNGIISFLSPCFLPLMPVYIGYLSGGAAKSDKRWNVIKNSIGFIIGFTIIFLMLGATASSLARFLLINRILLNKILGVFVIIMGLFYMDVIKIKSLNMEKRFSYDGNKSGFFGALFLGLATGFGWTPCTGPILASVLALAAKKASVGEGMYLLFIYSMGIAIPFLITALLIQGASFKVRSIMKYSGWIKIISGVILVLTGVMLYTGYFARLSGYFWR